MRKLIWTCSAVVLVVGVAACGGGGKVTNSASGEGAGSTKQYAELRWGTESFPGPLNIDNNLWGQAFQLSALAIQSLVEFEPNGHVEPSLASSIEHPNQTTYVYHLRSGVKFSDGKPLTVEDVLFSLQRNITGKESQTKTFWADVASISGRGNSTVVIKLKRPSPFWESILAFSGQIIEKAQAEEVGEKALGTAGHLPIGTGPWKFDSYKPEVSVQLSRNPYWTGPKQPANKITISLFKEESAIALALRSGAIDGTFQILSLKPFANIPGTRLITAPGANEIYAGMNTTTPPFNDVHVRRAIAYATDVKGMVNNLFPGAGNEDVTMAPPSVLASLGSESEVNDMVSALPHYEFNLAAAKRELEKSAYPHGFATKVQAVAGEESPIIAAQILSHDLGKIGIKASVDEVPLDAYSGLYGNKVTIWPNEFLAEYPDPEALMSCLLPPSQIGTASAGCNIANYNSPKVNKLETQESETTDQSKRLQLMKELLQTVGTEMPYRPLYTHDAFVQLSNKYVFPGFSNWTLYSRPWALDVKLAK
ncbi:MAG TPA: ABC transporter substrate-binding protein [Solirubrobacteraceae bacterium]|jgi:peptide/nickel transport system substrate-binding protein|nr:ABC transporter substrate-binding protein [Solirubrobacteraceae bacterium]